MIKRLVAAIEDARHGSHQAQALTAHCVVCSRDVTPREWNQDTYLCTTCTTVVQSRIRTLAVAIERVETGAPLAFRHLQALTAASFLSEPGAAWSVAPATPLRSVTGPTNRPS